MNNDLEQFSEERLKYLADGNKQALQDEIEMLARIALSAKQAKPVAITDRAEIAGLSEAGWVGNFMAPSYKGVDKGDEVWLYTTPQPAHTEQDGWIKCSERMPNDEQECLVQTHSGFRYVSFYDEHTGLFFDSLGGNQINCIEHILVTHWQPVAAPKPESE